MRRLIEIIPSHIQTHILESNLTLYRTYRLCHDRGSQSEFHITQLRAAYIPKIAYKYIQIGCDYAGIVEEVGSAVTKPFKKGTRVSGFAHGGNEVNHEDGAFANYITAKGDLQIEIPENLSLEEAATLGVGISTVGQALYQALDLPLPGEPSKGGEAILIYGGSSATGSLAIQYAKLSGLEVITTCSPHNFDYIKSLGAGTSQSLTRYPELT